MDTEALELTEGGLGGYLKFQKIPIPPNLNENGWKLQKLIKFHYFLHLQHFFANYAPSKKIWEIGTFLIFYDD